MATDGDELALRELAWRKAQALGPWDDVGHGQPNHPHAAAPVQTYTLEKAAEAERDARCLDLAMELKWSRPDRFEELLCDFKGS